jgi:predicted DNA-binding WGR domain protein
MRIYLEYIQGSSSKYYEVLVRASAGNDVVGYTTISAGNCYAYAIYGRIGAGSKSYNLLYNGDSMEKALAMAENQIRKKIEKGYKVVESERTEI